MRLISSFLISFLLYSTPLYANDHIMELEEILLAEIADSPTSKKMLAHPTFDEEGSVAVSKSTSMKEILAGLHECTDQEIVKTEKQVAPGFVTIAFACRTGANVITTSEVMISTENNSQKVVSYQKLEFEETKLPPSVLLNILAKTDMESIRAIDNVSPGIRTLLTIAQVGATVALSFKAAKILAPDRTDWQKHFVAGALISGATILTTQMILRTYARTRGWSDTKINILSSLAGLFSSIAAGAGKEIYDRASGRGTPEFKDAMFTAAGGAMVSVGVVIPLDRLFRRRGRAPVLAY